MLAFICSQDLGQGPFDLVTVTDAPTLAHPLSSSVQWPLRLRMLQPPAEYRPWKFRFFDAERYLLHPAQFGLAWNMPVRYEAACK